MVYGINTPSSPQLRIRHCWFQTSLFYYQLVNLSSSELHLAQSRYNCIQNEMAPRSPDQTSSSELPKTNIRPAYSKPRHQPTGRVISEDASIPLSTSDSTQFNTEATPKSISPQRPDHPLIYRTHCSYQPKHILTQRRMSTPSPQYQISPYSQLNRD